jgi:hypothetical protein
MALLEKCFALCFPTRNKTLSVFVCEEHTFVPNSTIQVNGTSTVFLVRKQSILEAGGSSTLFSCEN